MPDSGETQAASSFTYKFGTAEFDAGLGELRIAGMPVHLEQRPRDLLHELLRHAGEVVTKEELLDAVWGGRPTVENVLANAVAKLRKTLGKSNAEHLITLPRIGYRLTAPVERLVNTADPYTALALVSGQSVPGREHFRLSELLGKSHGNEVWLAVHAKTREPRVYKFSLNGRQLPTLKREATLSRFLRESLGADQGQMFAQIIDWNFAAPPFYLECQFGGQNLEQWAANENGLAARDQSERLAIFLQIARAVAAAHSVGVLHKDLKPSNILISGGADGAWQIRLTDFGSAKLLDPAQLEAFGISQIEAPPQTARDELSSGTPLYLAPELIAGDTPTALSDIYALGILLYQLLAGDLRTPMATDWQDRISNELLRQDIADATAGDRRNRLQSVAELIQRIENLAVRQAQLDHQRQTDLHLRETQAALARARARRPWIAAVTVSMLCGLLGMAYLYSGAEQARDRAEQVIGFWNQELVRSGNPQTAGSLSIVEVLDRAAERLPSAFPRDPATRARIHSSLGSAYLGQTRQQKGAREFELAALDFATAFGPGAEETLLAELQWARSLIIASQLEAGDEILERALRAAAPLQSRSLKLQYAAVHTQAASQVRHDNWPEAVALMEKAAQLQNQLPNISQHDWFRLAIERVDGYRHTQNYARGLELLDQMLAADIDPEQVGVGRYAAAQLQRGQLIMDKGDLAAAAPVLRTALDELRRVYGPEAFHVQVAEYDLADLYRRLEDWDQALELAQLATQGFRTLLGDTHIIVYKAQLMVGIAELYSGLAERARATLETVYQGVLAISGKDSASTQVPAYFYALALAEAGQFPTAAELLSPLTAEALRADLPSDDWDSLLPGLRAIIAWYTNVDRQRVAELRRGPAWPAVARDRMLSTLLAAIPETVSQNESPP